jgi:hypothetical protein
MVKAPWLHFAHLTREVQVLCRARLGGALPAT